MSPAQLTAYIRIDHDWKVAACSASAERLLQRPRSAILQQPLWDLTPTATGTPAESFFRRAMDGTLLHAQLPWPVPGHPCDLDACPVPSGLLLFIRSHSAQGASPADGAEAGDPADAEFLIEELREQAVAFQALKDIFPGGILTADAACRRITGNPAFYAMMGLPLGANASLPAKDSDIPQGTRVYRDGRELAHHEFPVQHTGRTGNPLLGFEHDIEYPDGRRVTLLANTTPLKDDAGRVRGVLGAYTDITERKRVERERAADLEAHEMLLAVGSLCTQPQAELGHCLEQILDAAMRLTGADKGNIQRFDDRTGMIRLVAQRGFDPAFCEFFAEVAGSDPSACGAAMRNGLRTVVDDVRTSPVFAGSAAREVVLAAGVRAVQSTPLISSTGDVIGMISTHWAEPGRPDERQLRWIDLLARQAADYLERTAREEELRRLNEELRERDRRKDEFLATLAHELRNPLAPIRSAVQALLLRHDAGAEAEWFHGVIERQVSHMSRLVDDLLDVSRMRHGKLEVRRERLDLSEIIFHAVEANRPHLESGRFDFEMALPDEPLMVEADPVRLAQVFGNLLHNATKFTPPGGRIRISAVLEDYRVAVSVRDSGIGLDPALVPRLFALFSQGSAAAGRMQEGLGVGLYLVGALVTLHGGTVDVRSEGPGMGTEFLVRLPLATARRPTPVPSQVAQPAVPARGKRRRVLVADDLRDGADTLAMLLEAMGHEAYPVYGGREALQLAEQLRPDLLFLDLGMPEMDGWEVCEQLRRAPWGRGLTVVALTGRGQDTDIGATLEAGFDRHLVKPVRRETLLEVLGSLPARG